MGLARTLLGTLVLGLLAASSAGAASYPLNGTLVGGPELAGDRVAWAQTLAPRRSFHLRDLVRTAAPGESVRTVFRTRDRALGMFDAGPGYLAFDWSSTRGAGRSGTEFTPDPRGGPLEGPFQRLPSCRAPTFAEALEPLRTDISGSLLATATSEDCDSLRGDVILRDLATATAMPLALPGRVVAHFGEIALAGRYAAFGEFKPEDYSDAWVTVYDWQSGTEVYRTRNLPLGVPSFDLNDDGTLAIAYLDEERDPSLRTSVIDWYSVADPTPHRLPHRLRHSELRVAGDMILAEVKVRRGRELAVLDLGGGLTSVKRFALPGRTGALRLGGFDFDGERVAYASRRARRVRVRGKPRRRLGPVVVHVVRAP